MSGGFCGFELSIANFGMARAVVVGEAAMPRKRRRVLSGRLYEVSFRACEGLPVVATSYMGLLLESIMARAQLVHPVTLVQYLWMTNHPHLLLIAKDSLQFVLFLGYIQEHLTKSLKELQGVERLSLFRDRMQVSEILDLDSAIKRLVYIFSNPAAANLESSIERYPGLNSWESLVNAERSVEAQETKQCPWVRLPMIGCLPRWSLSGQQDKWFTEGLSSKASESHVLEQRPLAWIERFNPDADADFIEQCIQDVVKGVRKEERHYAEARAKKGLRVLGRNRLKRQSIKKSFKPKKYSGANPYIICSDNKRRLAELEAYEEYCEQCDEAYQAWKIGDYTVEWPLGSFKPAMPPTANMFHHARNPRGPD